MTLFKGESQRERIEQIVRKKRGAAHLLLRVEGDALAVKRSLNLLLAAMQAQIKKIDPQN